MERFKLVGLQKVSGDILATCQLIEKEETFRASIQMTEEKKHQLWDLLHNNWWQKPYCICHVSYYSYGIPQGAVLTEVILS